MSNVSKQNVNIESLAEVSELFGVSSLFGSGRREIASGQNVVLLGCRRSKSVHLTPIFFIATCWEGSSARVAWP